MKSRDFNKVTISGQASSFPRIPIINEDKEELHLKCRAGNKSFKSKKQQIPQRKHKVMNENRIHLQVEHDTTELNESVTLFQRLLRGRAYQTMMIMAKIRYQPILNSNEKPLHTAENEFKEITGDDRIKHISRFFDTLHKESIHIKNSENGNMLIQQGRIACEMAERKQRQIEITGRIEQDKILKQVVNIHEHVSLHVCEKLIKEAVKITAKEQAIKAVKHKLYNIESDRNIANHLMSNFIIPFAHKMC